MPLTLVCEEVCRGRVRCSDPSTWMALYMQPGISFIRGSDTPGASNSLN